MDLKAISYLQEMRGVLSFELASLILLVYDYSLTLDAEIQLVWRAPWRIGKCLYILTRYLIFVGAVTSVYLDGVRFKSLVFCRSLSQTVSSMTFIELYIAEFILCLRVWAVWGRSRMIGLLFFLTFLLPAPIIALCLLLRFSSYHSNQLPDFYKNFIYGQFGLCPPYLAGTDTIVDMFIYLAATELVILLLTTYKAVKHAQDGHLTSFVLTFFRDGLMYNVVALASITANIVMRKSAPDGYKPLFLSLQAVLHSILTSRMLLHIREGAINTLTTHPSGLSQSLRFAPPSTTSNDDHDDQYRLSQLATAGESWTWFGEPF